MKRRDLLKGAGTLMLGAQALQASALLNPSPAAEGGTKDLVVTFNGPFAFWQSPPEMPLGIKVMAPQVGADFKPARHQPWFGTTTNEVAIVSPAPDPKFTLQINGFKPQQPAPLQCGTPCFTYDQEGDATQPLFYLLVPNPDLIAGARPTVVRMVCADGVSKPFCKFNVWASGWSFLYKNVDVSDGSVVILGPDSSPFFKACFRNDDCLPQATLGVNLTILERHPDPNHKHATAVWGQMLSMFPFMKDEITDIKFCQEFKPSDCIFDPSKCTDANPKSGPPAVGPGSDCESPICYMKPPGAKSKKYKKP